MLHRSCRISREDDLCSVDVATGRGKAREIEILTCCYCFAPLKPILMDINPTTGEQRCFWICKNFKKGTCDFPMGLPSDVFFVKRTEQERRLGYVPGPKIRLLPQKYRTLYPSTFCGEESRQKDRKKSRTSTCSQTGELFSSAPLDSPSTSSLSSARHATCSSSPFSDPKESEASVWDETVGSSISTGVHSQTNSFGDATLPLSSDGQQGSGTYSTSSCSASTGNTSIATDNDKSTSMAQRSSSTCSFAEEYEEDFAEDFLKHLQYTGVDIARLGEDKDLICRMEGVVKALHHEKKPNKPPWYLTNHAAPQKSLHHIDVRPIKKRLNALSTDLTRVVGIMRSKCGTQTLLDAMGGSVPAEVPLEEMKRHMNSQQLCKERAEAVAKSWSKRLTHNENREGTSGVSCRSDGDPTNATNWYDEENGPSSSGLVENEDSSSKQAEEERLNAIVQRKVRTHIENSAARRRAYRKRKIEEHSQQEHSQLAKEDSSLLHVNLVTSDELLNENSNLFALNSHCDGNFGYVDNSFSPLYEGLSVQQPCSSHIVEDPVSEATRSQSALSSQDLSSPAADNEFSNFFAGYDLSY